MLLVRRAVSWLRLELWNALKTRASAWLREAIDALTPARDRILFEPLEPRLLMSTDVLPPPGALNHAADVSTQIHQNTLRTAWGQNHAVNHRVAFASLAAPAVVQATPPDADGTTPSLMVTGVGSAQLTAQNGAYHLNLSGTNASTQVRLVTAGGDGRITLNGVDTDSAVGVLDLAVADLNNATINLKAGTTQLNVGSAVNSHLLASQTQLKLSALSWAGSSSRIEAASISVLSVKGNLDGSLVVGAPGTKTTVLDGVNVQGSVSGSWNINGRTNAVQIGSSSAGWKANVSAPVTQLYIRGDASGFVAATAIQVLQVGGSTRGFTVLVGADLGADAALGGTGVNADSFKVGTLARLRVAGDMIDSKILVGLNPVNGKLLDGDDLLLGTALNRIQELIVGGALGGSTRIIAPAFPATVRVGGQTIAPSTLSGLRTTVTDITAPTLSAALRNDTGRAANDAITNDPSLLLQAADVGGIASFEARIGSGAYLPIAATSGVGGYVVNRSALTGLNGGSLPDGNYVIELRAVDAAGNRSTPASVAFMLDTAAPVATGLGLASASDTGTLGDLNTEAASVTLVGQTGASVLVQLGATQTTAGAQGNFSFSNVPLTLGANNFSFSLTDVAGDVGSASLSVQRTAVVTTDNVPPVINSLSLVSDTGASATDGVTKDARIQGTASDNVGVTRLLVALDPVSNTPTYTDLSAALAANGSFALSKAQLDSLAGGTLANGPHTLRVVAADAAGNRSAASNLSFTLDTSSPAFTEVSLSAADASNSALDQTGSTTVQMKGQVEGGATVTLASQGLSAVAAANGAFVLPGVTLSVGAKR